MKKKFAVCLILVLTTVNSFAQNQRRIISGPGFEPVMSMLMPSFKECTLVNIAELWAGMRPNLTGSGHMGKSRVQFIGYLNNDDTKPIFIDDDYINLVGENGVPFSFVKTNLEIGQMVIIYYQVQMFDSELDISLAYIEIP